MINHDLKTTGIRKNIQNTYLEHYLYLVQGMTVGIINMCLFRPHVSQRTGNQSLHSLSFTSTTICSQGLGVHLTYLINDEAYSKGVQERTHGCLPKFLHIEALRGTDLVALPRPQTNVLFLRFPKSSHSASLNNP